MRLLLMRHAKAYPRDPHIFKDDSERPLTEKGEKEHGQVSSIMKGMGISFDHILTSPYERARATAKITKKAYDFEGKLVKLDELADSFSVDALLYTLRKYRPESTLLLVGHEPYMSILVTALLRDEGQLEVDFKKSAVMSIAFTGPAARGQGTLEFFLRPKLLRVLKDNVKGLATNGAGAAAGDRKSKKNSKSESKGKKASSPKKKRE